jgi:hypothetical protein
VFDLMGTAICSALLWVELISLSSDLASGNI